MKLTPDELARFNAKFEKTPGCWNWIGALNKGYGTCRVRKIQRPAHRMAFIIQNGAIPDGLHVLHKCDNPRCVNPEHLFTGTASDNMLDMVSKKRDKHSRGFPQNRPKGEENPHAKLTGESVIRMRRMSLGRCANQSELARMFNIARSTVSQILSGKRWPHIALDAQTKSP